MSQYVANCVYEHFHMCALSNINKLDYILFVGISFYTGFQNSTLPSGHKFVSCFSDILSAT
jgi:hypothetical protein